MLTGIGSVLGGIGSLAGAWGSYNIGKKQNKLIEDQIGYGQKMDAITANKQGQAQAELDSGLANVYGTKKKKEDKVVGSLSDAFVSPMAM
jgi:hypothetical protein